MAETPKRIILQRTCRINFTKYSYSYQEREKRSSEKEEAAVEKDGRCATQSRNVLSRGGGKGIGTEKHLLKEKN